MVSSPKLTFPVLWILFYINSVWLKLKPFDNSFYIKKRIDGLIVIFIPLCLTTLCSCHRNFVGHDFLFLSGLNLLHLPIGHEHSECVKTGVNCFFF